MKHVKNKTALLILLILLIAIVLSAAFLFFSSGKYGRETSAAKIENQSCVTGLENRTVRGTSLFGLIEPDSIVRIFYGYYDCNEIERGDVVAYDFAGNSNPIIKIAKGIPGDEFALRKAEEGGWNLLVNDTIIKNSKNQTYVLGENAYRMLSLYENDYKGTIPEDSYLLLGNLASGSLDSTHFGLASKKDILGKVEMTDQGKIKKQK